MNLLRLLTGETMFVDTPRGMFTSSGVWFRAREADVRSYAAAVFDHEALAQVLRHAEVWLRSPRTLALWVLPVLLLVLNPFLALSLTVTLYLSWAILGPSLANRPFLWLFGILDQMLTQVVLYAIVLSLLGIAGEYAALVIGLGGFIALRWGLVDKGVEPLLQGLYRRLYPLPVPDLVLRGLIRRAAMKYRVSLPELDAMEQDIWDTWYRNK